MPKISVIVPIYNAEVYLKQCIDSILRQTFEDLDIVLVDDGSKDCSGSICDEYAKKDARIQVVHKENGGLVSARKAGFKVAKGEYITFVDADDWLELDMYEKLMEMIMETQAQIICSNFVREDIGSSTCVKNQLKSGVYQMTEIEEYIIPNMLCYQKSFFEFGINPVVWCKVFQKETIGKALDIMDEQISYGEDVCLSFMAILNAEKIYIDEECFGYHYRILENSMSHEFSDKFYDKVYYLYGFLITHLGKEREELCRQLRYYLIWNIYNGIFREFSKQCHFDWRKRKQDLKDNLTNDVVKQAMDGDIVSAMPKVFLQICQLVDAGHMNWAIIRIYIYKLRLRLRK